MKKGKLIHLVTLATAAFGINPASYAQSTTSDQEQLKIDEIVVTARKREENLQDAPLAITSFGKEEMEKIHFSGLSDLANNVPSLSLAPFPNNSSAMTIFMRGAGTVDSEQIARDAGVGVYLDDVYLGRSQGLAGDLVDVERIEILRGPQGTLYGRNTIGGAVKFITEKPAGEFAFKQSITGGSFDYLKSVTTMDLPEYNGVSAKATYLISDEGGWVENPGDGPDFGEKKQEGYRLSLRANPSERLVLDYAFDHSMQDGVNLYEQRGGPGFFPALKTPVSSDRRDTASRSVSLPIRDDFKIQGHSFIAEWDVSDNMTLKSVTSYRENESDSIHDTMEAFNIPAAFNTETEQNQYSQEFLMTGYMPSINLDFTLGVFYFKEEADQLSYRLGNPFALIVNPLDPVNAFRQPVLSDLIFNSWAEIENESKAIYGELTWTPEFLNKRLSVSIGVRQSKDDRMMERFDQSGNSIEQGSTDTSSFDPSITIDYRWSDNIHTYLSRSQAYRTGGFNLRSPIGTSPFKKEKLVTYELGFKSTLWSERIRLNVAAFQSKYEDIQLDFIDPATNLVSTVNAGEAKIDGVELEVTALLTSRLQISLDYSYLDAELEEGVINPFTNLPLQNISMPFTPEHKLNTALEYQIANIGTGDLSARVSYSYTDEHTASGGPGSALSPIDDYSLLNARLSLKNVKLGDKGILDFALWVDNIEDKEYLIYHILSADVYGKPRSFGLNVTYTY